MHHAESTGKPGIAQVAQQRVAKTALTNGGANQNDRFRGQQSADGHRFGAMLARLHDAYRFLRRRQIHL